jgi:putative ABC transport system permease protein
LVGAIGSKALRTFAQSLPRAEEISLDWRIVLYTLACAIITTLLCGLFPAIRGSRRNIAGELAHAGRAQVSTRNPIQWLLVGVQVTLAVILLVGVGLLLRSFQELGRVSTGFDSSHVLTLRISGNWGETADMKKLTQRMNRTLEELRAVPGVRDAATTAILPGLPGGQPGEFKLAEGRAETDGKITAESRFVSNGYFTTMKIPMLAGEGCRESANYVDGIVVNRSFANSYLVGSKGIGYHLAPVGNSFLQPAEIHGIVADAREQGLNHEPVPTVHCCISAPDPSPFVLIRTEGEPLAMAQVVRRRINKIEPARSVFDIALLEERLSDTFSESQLRTVLLSMFALTAVSLACIGLYGTLSYFVTVRKREVGLRLALGALRGQIVRQFLLKGLAISLIGCAAGVILALAFARALSGMRYGVSTADTETFFSVVLLIITVTGFFIACSSRFTRQTDGSSSGRIAQSSCLTTVPSSLYI